MEAVITLILLGVVLLFLEIFLPGLITGLLGLICLGAGVALGYSTFGVQTGNLILVGVLVGLLVGTVCWLKYFPQSRIARKFVSESTVGNLEVEKKDLLHAEGTAYTPLRPSGTALIQGKRIDVVSEGGMIERGTPIRVIAIEGMRVVVRPIKNGS